MITIIEELKKYLNNTPIEEVQNTWDKYKYLDNDIAIDDAEEWLQNERDIWNHPYVSDRTDKNTYELAELLADFANFILKDK